MAEWKIGVDVIVSGAVGFITGLFPSLGSWFVLGKKVGGMEKRIEALEGDGKQTITGCGQERAACIQAFRSELAAGSKEFAQLHESMDKLREVVADQAKENRDQYKQIIDHLLRQKKE